MSDFIFTTQVDLNDKEVLVAGVSYDEWAQNPREWDNLGTLMTTPYYSHLADEEVDMDVELGANPTEHAFNLIKAMGLKNKEVVIFPVSKYEHGLVRFYIGEPCCPWDSGVIGFIYATKEKIRKWFGVKKVTNEILDKVIESFEYEMKNLTSYCNGFLQIEIFRLPKRDFELYGERSLVADYRDDDWRTDCIHSDGKYEELANSLLTDYLTYIQKNEGQLKIA